MERKKTMEKTRYYHLRVHFTDGIGWANVTSDIADHTCYDNVVAMAHYMFAKGEIDAFEIM
jgi:hypothetical protein